MNMNQIIKSLTTAQLLSVYNTLLKKSTTKFASRETGEKQTFGAAKVAGQDEFAKALAQAGVDLVALQQPAVTPKEEPATPVVAPSANKAQRAPKKNKVAPAVRTGQHQCPACGETVDQTAAGAEGTVAGDERNFCHPCGTEYWTASGTIFSRRKPGKDLGKSISASWKDAEVRAARSARHGVTVHEKGDAANKTTYKSVAEAFRQLRLPMAKHIKFRMEVKDVGSAEFEHGKKVLVFKLVDKA